MVLGLADHVYSEETLREIVEQAQDLKDSEDSFSPSSEEKVSDFDEHMSATAVKLGNFFNKIFTP